MPTVCVWFSGASTIVYYQIELLRVFGTAEVMIICAKNAQQKSVYAMIFYFSAELPLFIKGFRS